MYLLAAALMFAEIPAGAGEVPRPDKNMSPEQLVTVWYDIEFTRFARDYKNYNTFFLRDRNGATRERKAYRARIIIAGDDIDYKDYAVFLTPASIKGVAMLSWHYRDPEREREQWFYLPSMRKARRSSPAEDDENTLGTVLTVEEMTSWRPQHETYRLLGVQEFPGYVASFDGKESSRGEPCYVIEALPKRKNALRSKQILWLRENDGCCLLQEVFDKSGKRYKTIFRRFARISPQDYPAVVLVEAKDLRTGESTIVRCDKIVFNSGLDAAEFSVDYLQRMKW
jgi:outer membrane lipoprotein-sorting protein